MDNLKIFKVLRVAMLFVSIVLMIFSASYASKYRRHTTYKTYTHTLHNCIEHANWYCAKKHLTSTTDPGISDMVLWNYYLRTRNSKDFDHLWSFITTHNTFPNQLKLQSNLELILPKNFTAYEINEFFHSRPPITMTGEVRYIHALFNLRKDILAKKEIYKTWTTHHMSYSNQRYFYRLFKSYIDQNLLLQRFEYNLTSGKYKSAKWVKRYLIGHYKTLASKQYRLSVYHRDTNYLINTKQVTVYNLGVLYETIKYYVRHNQYDKAYYWVHYLDTHPRNLNNAYIKVKIDDLRLDLIHHLIYDHRYDKAYAIANDVANPYKNSSQVYHNLQFLAGWLALQRVHQPRQALTIFLALYKSDTSVNGHARSSYWIGRSYSALSKKDLANKWYEYAATYPTTYYGQVATMYLAQGTSVVMQVLKKPTLSDQERFQNHKLTQVVIALKHNHYESKASPFILEMASQFNTPGLLNLTAEKAVSLGNPGLGIMVGRIAFSKNIVILKYSYPVLNNKIDDKISVPNWLVNAVVRQESGFSLAASSTANAKGLMQLMPSTAKYVSKRIGTRFGRHKLTTDPSYNVQLGSAYLDMLIDSFDSYAPAIAAYNAGPTNVKNWITNFQHPLSNQEDYIDWIETIPFQETRHYVKRILIDSAIYHAMIENPDQSLNS